MTYSIGVSVIRLLTTFKFLMPVGSACPTLGIINKSRIRLTLMSVCLHPPVTWLTLLEYVEELTSLRCDLVRSLLHGTVLGAERPF